MSNTQVQVQAQPTGAFALQKSEPRTVEYVPFQGDAKVKLSVAIVQNYIAVKTKQGHTCSERDAIRFMMLCQARALNPFEGDAYLIGYDSQDGPTFSLITAHQAFLKRAEVHPEYDGMESGVVVRDEEGRHFELQGDFYEPGQTVVGGWAKVHFKNRKIPMFKKVRIEAFRKPFGVWKDNPEGMICKVAEADALRSAFPTKLGGMYLEGETAPEIKPVKGEDRNVSAPDFGTTPPDTVEVPNPELGAKPEKKRSKTAQEAPKPETTTTPVPENKTPPAAKPVAEMTRPELIAEIRGRLEKASMSEPEFLAGLYAREVMPSGTQLGAATSDTLKAILVEWDDNFAAAAERA